jgi:protein-S-isoprenylcysteine O-methyltransferase Ste14
MEYLFLALIWIAYCFLHSYMISIRFTAWMKRILKGYYAFYRLFYVIISFVTLLPVLYYSSQLASDVIITWRPPWSYIRYAIIGLSILIFLKAFFFDYDSLSFVGIRQIFTYNKKSVRTSGGITKSGLLGIVRHPMYLAAIIFLWCMTFRISDIIVNTLLTGYFIIGTLLEERKLVLEFGDSYRQYQKDVPMLVPFVKRRQRQVRMTE